MLLHSYKPPLQANIRANADSHFVHHTQQRSAGLGIDEQIANEIYLPVSLFAGWRTQAYWGTRVGLERASNLISISQDSNAESILIKFDGRPIAKMENTRLIIGVG